MNLHSHAAIRVLRREIVRLNEAKTDLMAAIGDPRIPTGVVVQQISQCNAEIDELVEGQKILGDILDGAATRLAAE